MINAQQQLSVVELVFYTLSLPTCTYILCRNGFSWMKSKWIYYLAVFSLLHTVQLIIDLSGPEIKKFTPTTASAVLSSLGIPLLLLVQFTLLDTVATKLEKSTIAMTIKLLYVPIIASIITLSVGLTIPFSNDPNTIRSTGLALVRGSTILSLLLWICLSFLCGHLLLRVRTYGPPYEIRCLAAIAISIPILEVRIVYACISFFTPRDGYFSIRSNYMPVRILMVAVPELFILFLGIGLSLMAPREKKPTIVEPARAQPEMHSYNTSRRSRSSTLTISRPVLQENGWEGCSSLRSSMSSVSASSEKKSANLSRQKTVVCELDARPVFEDVALKPIKHWSQHGEKF